MHATLSLWSLFLVFLHYAEHSGSLIAYKQRIKEASARSKNEGPLLLGDLEDALRVPPGGRVCPQVTSTDIKKESSL